ncbi:MAG: acyl-CoA thioesterase [Halobacteriovoraceae bacterium]|jgi:acyl-CoA thioesterase YciA|nr:acyl-CoA thioesterase [Halobacteriovoraceae bacterium]MBT5095232.1 acyl-CoA thioesterase [Halobacteriovoraceae bacterium]
MNTKTDDEDLLDNKDARGDLVIRTLAMPSDTNPNGDIFGGWVLSQMDIAGGIATKRLAKGRTVTIAVDAMTFHLPVFVGDVLCCYAEIIKVGRTSIQTKIEAWAVRQYHTERVKVTEGIFTYVATTEDRVPRNVEQK